VGVGAAVTFVAQRRGSGTGRRGSGGAIPPVLAVPGPVPAVGPTAAGPTVVEKAGAGAGAGDIEMGGRHLRTKSSGSES
jgi:hypothetical protein